MRFTTALKAAILSGAMAGAMTAAGQNTTNPITQIRWPLITGHGAPTSTCQATSPPPQNASAYGQQYIDMDNHIVYTCSFLHNVSPGAWIQGAAPSLFGTGAPSAACSATSNNGAIYYDRTANLYYICDGANSKWQGPFGMTGPTGPTGPQGPPINFRGPWSATVNYAIGDAVSYQSSSYVALVPNINIAPPNGCTSNATWALLACQGGGGVAGPPSALLYNAGGVATSVVNTFSNGNDTLAATSNTVAQNSISGYEGFNNLGRGYPPSAYARLPMGYTNMILKCQAGQMVTAIMIGTSIETGGDEMMSRDLLDKCGQPATVNLLAKALASGYVPVSGSTAWWYQNSGTPGNNRLVAGTGTSGPCANMGGGVNTFYTNIGQAWMDIKYDAEPEGGSTAVIVDGTAFGTINFNSAASSYWNDFYIPLDGSRGHSISYSAPSNGCGYIDAVISGPSRQLRGSGGFVYLNLALGGRSLQMMTGQQTSITGVTTPGISSTAVSGAGSVTVNVTNSSSFRAGGFAFVDAKNPAVQEAVAITAVGSGTVTATFANAHSAGFTMYPYLAGGALILPQILSSTNPAGGISGIVNPRANDMLAPDVVINFHMTNDGAAYSTTPCVGGIASGFLACFGPGANSIFAVRAASASVQYYAAPNAIVQSASDGQQYIYLPVPPFGTARSVVNGTTSASAPTFSPAQWSLTHDGTVDWYNVGPIATVTTFDLAELVTDLQIVNSQMIGLRFTEPANSNCFNSFGSNVISHTTACSYNYRAILNTLNASYQPPYPIVGLSGLTWNASAAKSLRVGEVISLVDWDAIEQGHGYAQSIHGDTGNPHPNDYGWGEPHATRVIQGAQQLGMGSTWDYGNSEPSEDMQPRFASASAYVQPTEPLCAPPGSAWVDTSNAELAVRRKFADVTRPTSQSGNCSGGIWITVFGGGGPDSGSLLETVGASGRQTVYGGGSVPNTISVPSGAIPTSPTAGSLAVVPGSTYTLSWVMGLGKYGSAAMTVPGISLQAFNGVGGNLQFDASTGKFVATVSATAAKAANCSASSLDPSDLVYADIPYRESHCYVTVQIPTVTQLLQAGTFLPPTTPWTANAVIAAGSYMTFAMTDGNAYDYSTTGGGTSGATPPTWTTGTCPVNATNCTDGTVTWTNMGKVYDRGYVMAWGITAPGAPGVLPGTWVANTVTAPTQIVRATVNGSEYIWQASQVAGTTGATVPAWSSCLTEGCALTDGTVSWKYRGTYYPAYVREARIDKGGASTLDPLARYGYSNGYGALAPQPQTGTPARTKPGLAWVDNSNSEGPLYKRRIAADGKFRRSTLDAAPTSLDECDSKLCGPVVTPSTWQCGGNGLPTVTPPPFASSTINPLGGGVPTTACTVQTTAAGLTSFSVIAQSPALKPSTVYTFSAKLSTSYELWAPNTAVLVNDTASTVINGVTYYYKVTTAGTTGGAAPAWCTTGNVTATCTTTDNTAVWTLVNTVVPDLTVPMILGVWYGTSLRLAQDGATWITGGSSYYNISVPIIGDQTPIAFTFTSPTSGQLTTTSKMYFQTQCAPARRCTLSDMQLVRGMTPVVSVAQGNNGNCTSLTNACLNYSQGYFAIATGAAGTGKTATIATTAITATSKVRFQLSGDASTATALGLGAPGPGSCLAPSPSGLFEGNGRVAGTSFVISADTQSPAATASSYLCGFWWID